MLGAGHLPLITVPTRTAEVTRSNGGSGITQMLIDHITSKRPVPPYSGVIRHSMSDHDICFQFKSLVMQSSQRVRSTLEKLLRQNLRHFVSS